MRQLTISVIIPMRTRDASDVVSSKVFKYSSEVGAVIKISGIINSVFMALISPSLLNVPVRLKDV